MKIIPKFIIFLLLLWIGIVSCGEDKKGSDDWDTVNNGNVYYIDSENGNDSNSGLAAQFPWKSLSRLTKETLHPGDSVRFKRGSSFIGPLFIYQSGNADKYITLTDYGLKTDPAPAFTNPVFKQDNFGNCIRIKGSYVIVENLYFHNTVAFVEGNYTSDGGWIVWEMGAIYIDKGAKNCIIRNNEMFDCVAGIRSYGEGTLIEGNYIHDCNRPLKEWNWGPLGIWLGDDYQEVRCNRIINIRGENPNYVADGADGGAIEIDDERFDKTCISLHHNFTQDCQGFLEIVLNDVNSTEAPVYEGFNISYNVCDDYSAFCKIRETKNCTIDNNTVIRRKKNSNEKGILVFKGNNTNNKVRNNIFVTTTDVPVFIVYNNPSPILLNNLYHSLGTMTMGISDPGASAITADPCFVNLPLANSPEDFSVKHESPAIDKGINLGYKTDFLGNVVPQGSSVDIGAFEIK